MDTNLGTHVVQKIMTISRLGEIVISGEFLEGSTAVGLLAVVYSINNLKASNVNYFFIKRPTSQKMFSATIHGVFSTSGPHNVSFFAVEENGLPFAHIATKVRELFVHENTVRYGM